MYSVYIFTFLHVSTFIFMHFYDENCDNDNNVATFDKNDNDDTDAKVLICCCRIRCGLEGWPVTSAFPAGSNQMYKSNAPIDANFLQTLEEHGGVSTCLESKRYPFVVELVGKSRENNSKLLMIVIKCIKIQYSDNSKLCIVIIHINNNK